MKHRAGSAVSMVESDDVSSFFASAPALEEEDDAKESVAQFVARHGAN